MYLYEFKIYYYEEADLKNAIARGIVAGDTYIEATEHLMDYFREDTVISLELKCVSEEDNYPYLFKEDQKGEQNDIMYGRYPRFVKTNSQIR